jgi:FG-GAP repeat
MNKRGNSAEKFCRRKTNNRWKWMAGATAATAAGVTTSQAGIVTINLTGNFISALGGNHLNADLTGDGQPDLVVANPFYSVYTHPVSGAYSHWRASVELNGVHLFARIYAGYYDVPIFLRVGSHYINHYYGYPSESLKGTIPVFFNDPHINGGALTKGSLKVTALGALEEPGRALAEVRLDSLRFNIPDDTSSLALLAMGASGVLALRRCRAERKPA